MEFSFRVLLKGVDFMDKRQKGILAFVLITIMYTIFYYIKNKNLPMDFLDIALVIFLVMLVLDIIRRIVYKNNNRA